MNKPDTIVVRRRSDGSLVQVYPDGRTEPYVSPPTDFAAVDAMTDEDIARQIAENPDAAPDVSDYPEDAFQRSVDVRSVRRKLDMTQAEFARTFAVPVGTLRGWEQRRRRPEGVARVLLQVIDREPEAVRRALQVGKAQG